MRHILAHEGLPGLWKGNVPAELMYVCYAAVQFSAYRSTTVLLHSLRLPGSSSSSSTDDGYRQPAPALQDGTCFPRPPSRSSPARRPAPPPPPPRTRWTCCGRGSRRRGSGAARVYAGGLARAVRDIARDEGPRGFFRGLAPTLAQIVPFMGAFFSVYEALRRSPLLALPLPLGGGGDAVAGVVAGVLAKTAVFPLDLVRKRIQVQGPTRHRYLLK